MSRPGEAKIPSCGTQLGREWKKHDTDRRLRADNWSPALQIRTILLSIQALLGAPNPDDPLAADVAKNWKEDEQAAIATAKEWTAKYAAPSQ